MTNFFGRTALLERINELHQSSQHISVVGPRSIGKTALLEAVVLRHAKGSDLFAAAGMVDFRHDPPGSTEAALRRVGIVLRTTLEESTNATLRDLAGYITHQSAVTEIYDQLKIAVDAISEASSKVLLVLDGCDPVLQDSAIPRNLWDNLRALAQPPGLRLMTGSRDHLHRLCYNPEARTSDFFRIFYEEPIIVGAFDQADWESLYADCGVALDSSARKELVNWTGGHPDLVDLVIGRVRELAIDGTASKTHVDAAAESFLSPITGRVDALWLDCPEESRDDVVRLSNGEIPSAEMPTDRKRYLVDRGIAVEAGRKVRLANRFVERIAGQRTRDVSGARSLFERPENFALNIRAVLEFRIAQIDCGDEELVKLLRRAVRHLPNEPDATLSSARDILDRALDLIWSAEAPGGRVPQKWIAHWQAIEVENNWKISAATEYVRDSSIPEERGRQCALLRLATGQHRIRAISAKVTKRTYVLVEHMNQIGDLKNHSRSEPTVTMATAFCMAAIELVESLGRELQP